MLHQTVTNVNYSHAPPSAFSSSSTPLPSSDIKSEKSSRLTRCRVPTTRFLLDLHLPPPLPSSSSSSSDTFVADDVVPPPTAPSAPILIHVHGGGWQRGAKDSRLRGAPIMGRTASQQGMVVACISYRLAPPSSFALLLRATIATLIAALIIGWTPYFRSQWDRIGYIHQFDHHSIYIYCTFDMNDIPLLGCVGVFPPTHIEYSLVVSGC